MDRDCPVVPPGEKMARWNGANRSEACRAEAVLKKLTREGKLAWARGESACSINSV